MKKLTFIGILTMLCLYLAGCGSPDKSQQDIAQPTGQAQAAALTQETSVRKTGTRQSVPDGRTWQEDAQDAQTEWDGQEEDTQETTNLVSIEDWKALPVGEYPINTESPESKTISFCDALAACDMPKEYAESLMKLIER